jgi:very-short-patch-repair endonuclease
VFDHLIRIPRPRFEGRSAPYASLEDLEHAIGASRRPGRGVLRAALALARVGSDSPAETSLRLALVRSGIPAPQLNVRVREDGVDLGEADLSWPEWKVCLEHEGPSHLTPEQLAKDIRRGKRRAAHGWLEIRTVAEHLRAGGRLAVREVRRALQSRGWTG